MTTLINNFKENIWPKFKKRLSCFKDIHSLFYYFWLVVLIGFGFFAVSLFSNAFTTPYSGDYAAQQISFFYDYYDDWHEFFRTGVFPYYDTNTYLGADNIASNSFYGLFDPFMFTVLLFPRRIIAQAMAITQIFKIGMLALMFYGYITYMGASDKSARIGGIAFAFCGFISWFLWFNTFTENAIVLVLIFWGIEVVLRTKKPWLLMMAYFISGVTNYFFMACFMVTGIIYGLWRYFQRIKLNSAKDNLQILGMGFVGFLAGGLLPMFIVLPSLFSALKAPRATGSTYLSDLKEALLGKDFKKLFKIMFDWAIADSGSSRVSSARYVYPIVDFFFPGATCRGTPLMQYGNETYDNVACSNFCFYPFIILLIPAIIRDIKRKNFWSLVGLILFGVSLFTPFVYYLFFGFTKPYSRWTVFVDLALVAYVTLYLDHFLNEPKRYVFYGLAFTMFGMILGAVLTTKIVEKYTFFTYRFDSGISIYLPISLTYVVFVAIFLYLLKKPKGFYRFLTIFLALEAVVVGTMTTLGHGTTDYITSVNYGNNKNIELSRVVASVNKEDNSYFRSYSSLVGDSAKNDEMRNHYNGASFFHSIYNFNTTNFDFWSMLITSKSSWSGRYVMKRQGLDKFLGVKYYFIEKDRIYGGKPNIPHDFVDVSETYPNSVFNVYEDTRHIDFAFSFDNLYVYNPEDGSTPLENTWGQASLSIDTNAWLSVRNDELFLSGGVVSLEDATKIHEENEDITVNDSVFTINQMSAKSFMSRVNKTYYYSADKMAKSHTVSELLDIVNSTEGTLVRPSSNAEAKYFLTITPKGSYEMPYDENGYTFYSNALYNLNTKVNIYIIGEDDSVITFDNHNDDRSTESSYRKGVRGFYVHKPEGGVAPKTKMILIVPRYNKFNDRTDFYYEGYTSFSSRLDKVEAYPITDVRYATNHFDFKTNFEKSRFVVTQIAYEKGWSVTAKDNDGKTIELPTYIADGGFVSFVAPKGDMTYSMDFYPAYMKEGKLLSMVGILIFSATFLAYFYMGLKLNKKNEDFAL